MLTFGEYAAFMAASARRARAELTAETKALIEGAVKDAQDMIGREDNEGWDPLKAATVAEKMRLGFVGRISATDPLARTFAMRDSIKGEAETTVNGVEAGFGSDDPVAKYQEGGTSRILPRSFISPASMRAEQKLEPTLGELAVTLLFPTLR